MSKVGKIISLILIIFSGLFLLLGIVFTFKYKTMDIYVEVPAYISDVERVTVRNGRSTASAYDYTINFSYDGINHQKFVKESSYPNKNLSKVWINPETLDLSLLDRQTTLIGAFIFFGMSVIWMVAAIISFILLNQNSYRRNYEIQH